MQRQYAVMSSTNRTVDSAGAYVNHTCPFFGVNPHNSQQTGGSNDWCFSSLMNPLPVKWMGQLKYEPEAWSKNRKKNEMQGMGL